MQIVCGAFDEAVARELDALVDAGETLAPCFAMVDPFGLRDTPMAVLRRILAHDRSEVYVSVTYEYINRFDEADEFEAPLSSLFGCDEWRGCVATRDAHDSSSVLLRSIQDPAKAGGSGAGHPLRSL